MPRSRRCRFIRAVHRAIAALAANDQLGETERGVLDNGHGGVFVLVECDRAVMSSLRTSIREG